MASEMILPSNTPNVSNWTKDDGYTNQDSCSKYPRRMFDSGLVSGLRVSIRLLKPDMDFMCIDSIHGFDIIISSPGGAVKIKKYSTFRIPSGEEAIATIRTKKFAVSPEVQTFLIEERHAFTVTNVI